MNKQILKRTRLNMKARISLVIMLVLAFALPVIFMVACRSNQQNSTQAGVARDVPPRPEGPGDIYKAGGYPLVAAHSTTRALYASYNGPLYQVMRQSDGKKLDIGVVKPSAGDAGGYADAAAQDAFCANTYCWITAIYDQSGKKNHLFQAPRGNVTGAGPGPAMGGFNNIPIADMAPITIMGHKVYGVFIEPGMGLRQNDAHGTAVDDQAEGQYWVISGHHYNSGCCYDYGNGEIDSRDDGDGTMETTYFGNQGTWYHGPPPGPWIMSDQENNLVGCVTDSPNNKNCDLPSITWRFVTATMDGEPHHWRTMGGDAQQGDMKVMFDGPRVKNQNNTYDPMRKQGAILLGNGGDNSNGSQGTFYEGAMTAAGTFPSQETNQKLQANIVAARYDVQRLSIAPPSAVDTPPGLQTFSPGSSKETTVMFKNTSNSTATGVKLSISVPKGWTSLVSGTTETSKTFAEVGPGKAVGATFKVTSGSAAFNGDIVGNASWTNSNSQAQSEKMAEKVRNISPIKINEFTNSFIEFYNAGDSAVDISNWTLTHHAREIPAFSSVKVPTGTKLGAKGFYVLGMSNSGLAVSARKGDTTIYVRSATGMNVGDTIEIDTGSGVETRKIAGIKTPAPAAAPAGGRGGGMGGGMGFGGGRGGGGPTTVWQPLPDGPVITIPAGSTSIPVTSTAGFEVGQKIAIGYGATYPTVAQAMEKYEVLTVTAVDKPGTQAWLSMDTKPGDTNIKVSSVANISPGEKIRLGYDTLDHGVEWVTVKTVGTAGFNPNNARTGNPGTGLDLTEPLKFHHSANTPFNARGTGISFERATKFAHSSNEPVMPLTTSITLDSPLANDHDINASVHNEKVTTEGYQGKPNQWFGGPAISNTGNMVLRDAAGLVADSLNFGGLIDPWAAEGYQGGTGSGCSAPAPSAGGMGGRGGRGAETIGSMPSRSAGRFPDGADTDTNCRDFLVQTAGITVSTDSAVGANNIKVDSVAGLSAGQTITVDSGENRETAVIATVGTAGATTVGTATEVGATVILVANTAGFNAGQTITIDSGANLETALVASVAGGGRGGRGGPGGGFGAPGAAAPAGRGTGAATAGEPNQARGAMAGPGRGGMSGEGRGGMMGGRGGTVAASITVSAPLKFAHAAGVQVSGSGITFTTALTKAHAIGAQVNGTGPTPGAANQYARSSQGGRRGN